MKKISNLFLFGILICFVFIALEYKGIGHSDTNEFTPLLYRVVDDSYLKNDWFVNEATASFNVRLYFVYFIFFISKAISNISLIYCLLYSFGIILAAISVYLCSKILFKDKKVGLLNIFLVIFGATFSLGGILIFTSNLSSFLVSMGLSMLGFYFLFDKKLNYFSISFGLVTLIHFVSGHIIFGLLFLSNFISSRKDKKTIIKQIIALAFFAIFSISTLPNLIADRESGMGFSGEALRDIVGGIRAPHHYLPFEWPITRYIEFGLFFILFIISLKHSKIDDEKRNLIISITYVLFILIALNIFFVEIIPVKIFIKLNLFRLTTFFVFIQYLFIGNFAYNKMREYLKNKDFKLLIYPALLFSLLSNHLILASIPLFLLYLNVENKIKINKKQIIALGAVILLLIIIVLFNDKMSYFFKQKINTLIFLSISMIILLVVLVRILFDQKLMINLTTASIILSIIFFAFINYPILNESFGKYDEAYKFIKENTNKNSIFLTPPELNSFRLGAHRAIVADFKSFPFGEKQMLEWKTRMLDVGGLSNFKKDETAENQIIKGYNNISYEQVINLKDKYGISYAFFNKPKSLPFNITYQDKKVIIYNLDYISDE